MCAAFSLHHSRDYFKVEIKILFFWGGARWETNRHSINVTNIFDCFMLCVFAWVALSFNNHPIHWRCLGCMSFWLPIQPALHKSHLYAAIIEFFPQAFSFHLHTFLSLLLSVCQLKHLSTISTSSDSSQSSPNGLQRELSRAPPRSLQCSRWIMTNLNTFELINFHQQLFSQLCHYPSEEKIVDMTRRGNLCWADESPTDNERVCRTADRRCCSWERKAENSVRILRKFSREFSRFAWKRSEESQRCDKKAPESEIENEKWGNRRCAHVQPTIIHVRAPKLCCCDSKT